MEVNGHFHVTDALSQRKQPLHPLDRSLDTVEKRKIFYICEESNHNSSAFQPVARC
jgi:hypothetical protein